MSYYVGQLRKSSEQTYMEKVKVKSTEVISQNPFGQAEDHNFIDFALIREENQFFQMGKVYYLRFAIKKIPLYFYSSDNSLEKYNANYAEADTLNLTIQLQNVEEENSQNARIQKIGTCTVPPLIKKIQGINVDVTEYSHFTFVFCPKENMTYLVFKIQRNTYDAIEKYNSIENNNGSKYNGRNWLVQQYISENTEEGTLAITKNVKDSGGEPYTITVDKNSRIVFQEEENSSAVIDPVNNKILVSGQVSQLKDIHYSAFLNGESAPFIKIGYQSRPGGLIVINKEPIRIGRSGIFEINNGIPIQEFMIANPGGTKVENIDAFLLDYAYQK